MKPRAPTLAIARMVASTNALEARSRAAGTTMTAICRQAHVMRSTYTRWKSGETEPQHRVYRKILAALEAAEARRLQAHPHPRQSVCEEINIDAWVAA